MSDQVSVTELAQRGTGRVLVVGDVMTDIIVMPEGPLVRGADRRATITIRPGGSGANQAAWLGHRGARVSFAGKVGRSDFDQCAAALRQHGVEALLATDESAETGTIVSIIAQDGERSFLTSRGANDTLTADDLPPALLDGTAILHVSGYALVAPGPRTAIRGLIEEARRRDILVTVDPGSSSFLAEIGVPTFLEATKDASICFPNLDEAAVLAGTRDEGGMVQSLTNHYPLVVLKRGAAGALAASSDGTRISVSAPVVPVLDSTGAGDAFLAAFLSARLERKGLDECLRQAVEAGALAVTLAGGRPPSARVDNE